MQQRLVVVGALASAFAFGCSSAAPSAQDPAPPPAPAPAPQPPGDATAPGGEVSTCQPELQFTGEPVTAPAGQWTWVPVDGAICRDGSPTGIGVRLARGSKKVVIYLEGGGACFHDASCAINDVLASFGANEFGAWVAATGSLGIFDDSRTDNPFHDWNVVYVPYCTGDVHAGWKEHVDVPGDAAPKDQMFVGYRNFGLDLQRLVPTFKDATDVVITGISAGGFGAAFNYDRTAQAFCNARVSLIDDSGPPMADQYLSPCLQQRWRDLWNLDATLPKDCTACRGADGGGIVNYLPYLAKKYPKADLGLVSSNQDSIISLFFGFGANDCQGLYGPSAGMSGAEFEAGLMDLEHKYLGAPNLAAYVVPSISHTWITALTFYTTSVSGMALPEWANLLANQHVATQVLP